MTTEVRFFAAVATMAVVTYLPRMLPLTVMKRKIKNRFLRSFLDYVPYAVLAAMTFPAIFTATDSLISALAGLGAALALSWHGRSLLTVALGSTAAALLVQALADLLAEPLAGLLAQLPALLAG